MSPTRDQRPNECACGRHIPRDRIRCRRCAEATAREPAPPPPPSFDGDTRSLVARCALRGIPAGVLAPDGSIVAVRTLAELDAIQP